MIVFDNILAKLSAHGWSAYRLAKEKKLGNGTITRIRHNESISTETLNTICELCNCQPSELIHYESDKQGE